MSKIIHRKKLFGGRETAQEVQARLGFPPDARCSGCKRGKGALKSVARTFWPIDELLKRDPVSSLLMQSNPAKFMELVTQTKHGPHVRMSTTYCCADTSCQRAFQLALTKLPSWVLVDRNDGPGADTIVSGWAG